ncbi:MAG: diguanylate cyclase [Coriobacteriia bacterium]|nr:diguanylate cyclase [Coriobacteriia bacterium]
MQGAYPTTSNGKPSVFRRVLRRVVLAVGIVAAIVSCMAFALFYSQDEGGSWRVSGPTLVDLNSGWVIVEGPNQGSEVQLPGTLSCPAGQSVTIQHAMEGDGVHNYALTFRNLRQRMQVLVDDTVITGYNMGTSYNMLAATGILMVDLGAPASGSSFSLRIYSTNGTVSLPAVAAGAVGDVWLSVAVHELPTLINIILLISFSIVLVASTGYFRVRKVKDNRPIFLAMFAAASSLWAVFDSSLLSLFPVSLEVGTFISYLMFMLMPIPVVYYTRATCRRKYALLDWLIFAGFAAIVVVLLLSAAGITSLDQTLLLNHLYVGSVVIGCMGCAWADKRSEKHTRWSFDLFNGFIVMFLGTLASLAVYWAVDGDAYRGVMLTVISLFFVIMLAIYTFSSASDLRKSEVKMERLKIYERLSRTDSLTGLGNRREFEDRLLRIKKNQQAHKDAVLYMFDLNGLKITNDTYGHTAGDDLIVQAAKCIVAAMGGEQDCFRIGGDEFTAIRDDGLQSVDGRVKALHQAMSDYNATSLYKLSIAHGESALQRLDGSFKQLSDWKQEADMSMYADKRLGSTPRGAGLTEEFQEIIRSIVTTIEAKDTYTAQHSSRVKQLSVFIACKLGLSDDTIDQLSVAAELHDIGKIAIPDQVLLKPARLTDEEYAIMKQHTVQGALIFQRAGSMQEIADIVRHHHERWDGLGYPDGLSHEDIPVGSRIIAIADSIDAMTTKRVYRDAFTIDHCKQEVEDNLGKMYDPAIGRIVLDSWDEVVDILLSQSKKIM